MPQSPSPAVVGRAQEARQLPSSLPSWRAVDFDEYYREQHPSDFDDPEHLWHPRNAVWVAHRHQIETAVLDALDVTHMRLEDSDILEVGCGSGRHLRFLAELGATPSRLHGIDLLASRLEIARS